MTAETDRERSAAMSLAAISEPGDTTTGALASRLGAVETLNLVTDPQARAPAHFQADQVAVWRQRLAPRLEDGLTEQLGAQTQKLGLRVLVPGEAGWPVSLADLGDSAPLVLWVKGDSELLTSSLSSRVTLTGARAASRYGTHVAAELSEQLAAEPRILVSGGAYGIDAVVHRSALASRSGSTVAVLAGGLGRYYPASHIELFERVAKQGLLLSELPPSAAPTRWRFLARSRLLAALSGATVIVEAGARSGTLVTAARANEIGRPVGAVPGPVTSATSAGCHRILREDIGTIVTNADDVRAFLDPPRTGWALGQKYEDLARAIEHEPPSRALNM